MPFFPYSLKSQTFQFREIHRKPSAVCLHMAKLYLNMLIVDSNTGGNANDSDFEKG